MSRLLGNNPQVFLCSNVTGGKTSITDQVAVNLLLNNTSSLGWSDTVVTDLNTSNLVVSMATNKSLIVSFNNEVTPSTATSVSGPAQNITTNNTLADDNMWYNSAESDILMDECFSYLSVPTAINSTPVLVDGPTQYTLTLAERPTTQAQSNALNYLRIMNMTNSLSAGFSINFSATNVTNALGVEGKVFYYNGVDPSGGAFVPFYRNITNYQPISTRNVALTYGDWPDQNGTYEMIQMNWSDPLFNPTASWVGARSSLTFNALNAYNPTSISYTGFAGSLNYTGTMGNNINSVATSTLVLNLTNYSPFLGTTFTQPLVRFEGYSLMDVASGYTGIPNFSSTNSMNLPYGNIVEVQYYAGTFMLLDQGQPNPPTVNNVTAIQVVNAPSVMPVYSDNLTICFNSANRSDVYTNGGLIADNNLTATIVYAYDFNTNLTSSLNAEQMTTANVFYNATTLAKWTRSANGVSPILPTDAVTGALVAPGAGQIGMSLTPPNANNTNYANPTNLYIKQLTVTGVPDMVGYINPAGQYNLTLPNVYQSTYLPYLLTDGTINGTFMQYGTPDYVFNSSNGTWLNAQGLQMDTTFNQGKQGVGIINGSIGADFLSNNASSKMRFLFTPKLAVDNMVTADPNPNTSVTTNAGVSAGDPSMLWTNTSNIVAYAPTYFVNGPVTYENWPATYVQSYEIVFPEEYELRNGNLRPQALLVNGVQSLGSSVPVDSNVQQSKTLSNYNFSGFCVQSCQSVSVDTVTLQVTASVIVPICLSGMQSGLITNQNGPIYTTNISIPISYNVNINAGNYQWPSGKPSLKLWYKFPSTRTHTLEFQGISTTDVSYQNLANVAPTPPFGQPSSWDVDLRQSSDILFFRRYNGPTTDYNVNICLYPQTQTQAPQTYQIYNVAYMFPVSTTGTASWEGAVASLKGNNNVQYLNGLSKSNLQSFFANTNVQSSSLNRNVNIFDTLVGNTDTVNVIYNTTSLGSFNVTIVYPDITEYNGRTYFATMADHLMSLGASGVAQPANENVTGGNMMFTTRNGPYKIDSGVYINGNMNYSASSVGTQAFNVSLLKDQYWAIAYPGQNFTTTPYNVTGFIPDLVLGNATLVSTTLYDDNYTVVGTTAGLNSLIVRGYPTQCYTYDRTSTTSTATWGGLTQTIDVDPPSNGTYALLSFNYGQNLNMQFNITVASSFANTYTNVSSYFYVAKTSVSSVQYTDYQGNLNEYVADINPSYGGWGHLDSTGTLISDMVDGMTNLYDPSAPSVLAAVPWLDLVGLNNIYYQGQNNMNITIQYTQGDIKTSIAPFASSVQGQTALDYVTNAPFNTTISYTDAQLAAYHPPGSYIVQRDGANFTFDPSYVLRNVSGAFYVDFAPLDTRFQWLNAVAPGSGPSTSTQYALLYNSSSLYTLTADGTSASYQLNVPSLEPFRNSVRTVGQGVTALNISGNFIYNPNAVSLKGVQSSGSGVFNITTVYFANQNLAKPTQTGGAYNLVWNTTTTWPGATFTPQYKVSLLQNGAAPTSGDEVALVFSSNNLLPTWNNGYQYNNASLCVAPDQSVVFRHYDLAWNMNPTTLKLVPTVYKYDCVPSNYNYYGATGTAFNIYDGNSIGYINAVGIQNVSVLNTTSSSFANAFANLENMYPYLAISDTYYPSLNSNTVNNFSFGGFNVTQPYNVTANSDFSYKIVNQNGRDLWHQYFVVPADNFSDAKVINLYNKDQIAVVGPGTGNDRQLMLRVGPDGVLYTNDVSAYGYLATANNSPIMSYDGVNTQLVNANVNLGQY